MITHRIGNMLTDVSQGIIIQGCNCQGKMGSGLAKVIKDKWPIVFEVYYSTHVKYGGAKLGDIIPVEVEPGLWVVNCMTQDYYGTDKRYVDYEAIVLAMENLAAMCEYATDIVLDINMPLIGAGLAGGNWNIIEAIIDETLSAGLNKRLQEGRDYNLILWTRPGQKLLPARVSALPK